MSEERAHDMAFMRAALGLAARALGQTWPNPAVACLIVSEEAEPRILARGITQKGGRPHAETVALAAAGTAARGATAYVSLEPCAHHGRTPPCADALIEAGIARVVAACIDPDPRVSGKGIERLRGAGVTVVTGVLAREAEALNAGFIQRVRTGLPLVTLKLATSLDGQIATHGGESQWITGDRARAEAHRLRAVHDAILIGSTTAISDDPLLTCRLPGLESRSPVRVVADSHLRLSLTSQLVRTARETPLIVLTRSDADPQRRSAFASQGIDVIDVAASSDQPLNLRLALKLLAERGITRLLVEGGAKIAATLLSDDLVDHIVWLRAPRLIGGDGQGAIAGLGLERLADARRFARQEVRPLGDDLMEVYARTT